MRKALLVICTLLLTSCIDVKDFGTYWAQGTIDPKMAGMWEPVAVPGWDLSKASKQHIVVKGDAYSITNYENNIEKIDSPIAAKLIKIGAYDFLMTGGPTEGALYRYKLVDHAIQLYALNKAAAQKLVQSKYPFAKNIDVDAGQNGTDVTFNIKTLDAETVQILSTIPDEATYWTLDSAYKKQP